MTPLLALVAILAVLALLTWGIVDDRDEALVGAALIVAFALGYWAES